MLLCIVLPSLVPSTLTSNPGLGGFPLCFLFTLQFAAGRWGMFSCVQRALPSTSGVSWGHQTRHFRQPLGFLFIQSHGKISKFFKYPHHPQNSTSFKPYKNFQLLKIIVFFVVGGVGVRARRIQSMFAMRCRLDLQTLEVKTVWAPSYLYKDGRCSVIYRCFMYLALFYTTI